jgi:hypothetical protein
MDTACSACQQKKPASNPVKQTGIWGLLLLGILPKCPFCIMAYTSTALMCSNGVVSQGSSVTFHSSLTIGISIITSLLVILGIVLNWRDKRTFWALSFALTGIAMVLYSVMKEGGTPLYYAGVVLVFVGVWVNGSFAWLMSLIKRGDDSKPASWGGTI